MKRILLTTLGCMVLLAAAGGLAQAQSGRYDQQILSNVARVLAGNPQYKNVTVQVEDSVVTLAGSVELESTRRNLTVKVSHIAHVAGVENQLTLSPAAPPDHLLYGAVKNRLQDAGYSTITIEVHEGIVILTGAVRTQRDWNRAREIASLTPGVKEVESRLQIVTP